MYFDVCLRVSRVLVIGAARPADWLWHTQVELPHKPYLSQPHLHSLCENGMQILPVWLTSPTCFNKKIIINKKNLVNSNDRFSTLLSLCSALQCLGQDNCCVNTFGAIIKGNDRRITRACLVKNLEKG